MSASDDHDPFDCFGDSSSDEDNTTTDAAADADFKEAQRLKEKSNAGKSTADIISSITSDMFEIFDAPLSGKGLRATVAYKCGDEIMRESAAMRIPNSQPASSQEAAEQLHKYAIQRAYNSMHETTQLSFMDLSSCNEDGIEDVIKTPAGVYDTNSFRLGNDPLGGVFLTIARINHSCLPNVSHFWRPNLQQTLVFATRDIDIGEELCTMYGPSECMDTESRREYLSDRFSFQCMCEMCLEGNTNGGDERMIKIKTLHDDIAFQSSTGIAALESVEKCLDLMKEQGIGGGAFTKSIYHRGHDICIAAGDKTGARAYLANELIAVRDSEGIGSPKAIEIEHMLNRVHSC